MVEKLTEKKNKNGKICKRKCKSVEKKKLYVQHADYFRENIKKKKISTVPKNSQMIHYGAEMK